MANFLYNVEGAGSRPIEVRNAGKKLAGKVLSVEYRLPWKEAAGTKQYGNNTADGVNMVLLITDEALLSAADICGLAVYGRNVFPKQKGKQFQT